MGDARHDGERSTPRSVADGRRRAHRGERIARPAPPADGTRSTSPATCCSPPPSSPTPTSTRRSSPTSCANATGDLIGAIAAMIAGRPALAVAETIERAERAARLMAANGYGAVRTHADTTLDNGLISVEALVEVRRRVGRRHRHRDRRPLRLADHRGRRGRAARPARRRPGGRGRPRRRVPPPRRAAARGRRPRSCLEIAADHGVGVDLHTDETLDPAVDGLADLAALVTVTGFDHPVTASHCVSLGDAAPRPTAARSPRPSPRRHRRRRAAGDEPLPAGPGPTSRRCPGASPPCGRCAQPAWSWPPAPTTCRTRSTRWAGPARSRPPALMVLTDPPPPRRRVGCGDRPGGGATGRPPAPIAPAQPADLIAVRAGTLARPSPSGRRRLVWRSRTSVPTRDLVPRPERSAGEPGQRRAGSAGARRRRRRRRPGAVCSAMLCDSPPTLGVKIIAVGHTRASIWASWPAPLGIRRVEWPSRCAVSSTRSIVAGSNSTGSKRASERVVDRHPLGRGQPVAPRRPGAASACAQHGVVGVAQVDGQRAAGGHDVDEVGVDVDPADRRDLRAARVDAGEIADERRDRRGDVRRRRAAGASASCRRGPSGR